MRGGDHRVAEEGDVHPEPAEMDDRDDVVDQRRAADAEGALDEQIGGQPGSDAADRGLAGARAQDEPAELRDQQGAMQAERDPSLGAFDERKTTRLKSSNSYEA